MSGSTRSASPQCLRERRDVQGTLSTRGQCLPENTTIYVYPASFRAPGVRKNFRWSTANVRRKTLSACPRRHDFYNDRDAPAFLVLIPDKAAVKQFKPPAVTSTAGAFFWANW